MILTKTAVKRCFCVAKIITPLKRQCKGRFQLLLRSPLQWITFIDFLCHEANVSLPYKKYMTTAKFIAFEKVRRSGLTNMYDINQVKFMAASKYKQILTNKDCFDCMLNYDKYRRKYLENKTIWKQKQ